MNASSLRIGQLAGLIVALSLLIPSIGRAQSSEVTVRFLAMAKTGSAFIDDAGRTAIANGASPALQRFAHDAVFEQDRAQRQLAPWAPLLQSRLAGPIVYDRPMFENGPIGLAFVPLNAAVIAGSFLWNNAVGVTAGGAIVTSEHLAKLEMMQSLSGQEFDKAYVATQQEAYRTLWSAYDDYTRRGDDMSLRKIASAELPALKKMIDRLKAF